MADLDARTAVARLDRRSGVIEIRAREQARRRYTGGQHDATYRCTGREAGAAIVLGPSPESRTWVLKSDADRAALTKDVEERLARANAEKESPTVEYVLRHVDAIETDGGYGQIGCLFALASTVVGWVLGLAVAFVISGGVPTLAAVIAPIVGFVGVMYSSDAIASVAVTFPPARDRIVGLAYLYTIVVPGLVTASIMILFRNPPS